MKTQVKYWLTHCIQKDFPLHHDVISLELPIVYFRGYG